LQPNAHTVVPGELSLSVGVGSERHSGQIATDCYDELVNRELIDERGAVREPTALFVREYHSRVVVSMRESYEQTDSR
jgi:hypothetical protein